MSNRSTIQAREKLPESRPVAAFLAVKVYYSIQKSFLSMLLLRQASAIRGKNCLEELVPRGMLRETEERLTKGKKLAHTSESSQALP